MNVQETKKKATKAAAKPKADKPKPEKKRAAPVAKKETKKAKKDPNAPKRGLSAFMFFSNAKRDEVLLPPSLSREINLNMMLWWMFCEPKSEVSLEFMHGSMKGHNQPEIPCQAMWGCLALARVNRVRSTCL